MITGSVSYDQLVHMCKGAPDAGSMLNVDFNKFGIVARDVIPQLTTDTTVRGLERRQQDLIGNITLRAGTTAANVQQYAILYTYREFLSQQQQQPEDAAAFLPSWNYLETVEEFYDDRAMHPNKFGQRIDHELCVVDGVFSAENPTLDLCLKRNLASWLNLGIFYDERLLLAMPTYAHLLNALDLNLKLLSVMLFSQPAEPFKFLPDPLYYAAICFNSKVLSNWRPRSPFKN